jgi:hypothetical protein
VQEVLINVVETIAHCKSNSHRGAVLAVDMAKAFDSLDHEFIAAVYRFFGLGDNIIKWLRLLGNSRMASVMMDRGQSTPTFPIETGSAQGDNPSPNIFNFCEQILIFKLDLVHRIVRIPRPEANFFPQNFQVYSAESNRETDINESLADDNTVLTIIDKESLITIKNILTDFAQFSGLHCNFEKTSILPIFQPTEDERQWIEEAGFTVTNSIKLLGVEITVDPDSLSSNFNNIIGKIENLINFWSRFRLSLPGRIAISKTFLVSQINYIGCIFTPTDDQLDHIQRIYKKKFKHLRQ